MKISMNLAWRVFAFSLFATISSAQDRTESQRGQSGPAAERDLYGVHAAGQRLHSILDELGLERSSLSALDAATILSEHQDDFFGNVNEFGKYSILSILIGIIKNAQEDEKEAVESILVELFMELEPPTGEPTNWGEMQIASSGGGLGGVVSCLLSIGRIDSVSKILDASLASDGTAKLEILLTRIRNDGKFSEYKRLIQKKASDMEDTSIKSLLEFHLAAEDQK